MARREREGTWKNSLLWKNAREAGAMALGHPRSCPTTGVTDLLLTRAGSRFSLSLYLPPPAQGSPPNLPDLTSILLFLCPLSQLAGASKPPGCYLSLLAACLPFSPWWGSQAACNWIPDTDSSLQAPPPSCTPCTLFLDLLLETWIVRVSTQPSDLCLSEPWLIFAQPLQALGPLPFGDISLA